MGSIAVLALATLWGGVGEVDVQVHGVYALAVVLAMLSGSVAWIWSVAVMSAALVLLQGLGSPGPVALPAYRADVFERLGALVAVFAVAVMAVLTLRLRQRERLALQRAQAAESAMGDKLQLLQVASMDGRVGGWSFNLHEQHMTFSDETARIHGLPPGSSPTLEAAIGFYVPDCRERITTLVQACAQQGTPFDDELQIVPKGAAPLWVRVVGHAERDAAGRVVSVQGAFQDIHARKLVEQRMLRLSRLNSLLSQTNAAMVGVRTHEELFDTVCRIAVESGGIGASWIGLANAVTGEVQVAAKAGAIDGYLEPIPVSTHAVAEGMGPFGTAVRENRAVVCNDTDADPSFAPWRERALAMGYRSVAVFPLRIAGRVAGAVVFYADVAGFFDAEEVSLFSDLTDDIAFAAGAITQEQALRSSEARFRAVFDQAPLGVCMIASNNRFLRANAVFCEMLGFSEQELIDHHDSVDTTHPDDRAGDARAVRALLASRERVVREKRYLRKDGTVVLARLTLAVFSFADSAEVQFLGMVQDIGAQNQAKGELIRSLERFRELADAMPLVVWTADPSGEVDFFTQALSDYTGDSQSDIRARGWLHLLHPEDQPKCIQFWTDCTAAGETNMVEFRLRRHDAAYRWHLVRAVPAKDADGQVVKWYGSATDIHDQKLLEQESRVLANRLTRTLASIADAFFTVDRCWHITFLNEQAARLMGRVPDQMVGRELWQSLPHSGGSLFERESRRAMRDNVELEFEDTYTETQALIEIRVYPSEEGLAIHFRDITARRQAESQLRLLETAVARLNDIVLITEADPLDEPGPRIVFVNEAFERRTGYARDEILNRSPRILQGPGTERSELNRIRTAMEQRMPVRAELLNYKKNGEPFWLELDIVPIADAGGRYTHWVAVERDITERRKLQEQLHQSQRLEAVGQLTGGMAHDFNNLLTVIMGNAEVLAHALPDRQELHEMARMIGDAAQRGAELTQRMLAFARRQPLQPCVVDIHQLIEGMDALLRRTLGEHIQIVFTRGAGLWRALVDPAQLESALLNLCLNARDAMPEGGRLTVETNNVHIDERHADWHADLAPGRYVMVAVSDTGVGIAPEVLNRVVEPFFTTKDKSKGTGLGLSMVYGFVKQSRGHVSVHSELGQGTTVKMYMPWVQAQITRRPTQVQPPVEGGMGTILLVEDDALVRRYASGQLLSLGYKVIEASDGPSALRIAEQDADQTIDLLFTDIVMPGGMNGRVLAQEVLKLRPALPVLFTSGYSENTIVHHGRLDADVQLLSKPYRRAELARRVRESLQASTGPREA